MNSRPFAAALTLSLLAGCNVGPKFHKPETKVNAKFSGRSEGGYKSQDAIVDWWRKFNDSQLNSYVSRALANNPDLKIAAARVEEAMAFKSSVRLDYFPTVTSRADYTNTQRSLAETSGFGPRSIEILKSERGSVDIKDKV